MEDFDVSGEEGWDSLDFLDGFEPLFIGALCGSLGTVLSTLLGGV